MASIEKVNRTPSSELALALNELRSKQGGLTLRTLANRSKLSTGSIQGWLSGRALPRREPLLQFLEALDSGPDDTARVLRLWDRAVGDRQSEQRGAETMFRSDIPVPQFGQPDPLTVATPAQLVEALRAVRIWAGSPSLRTLANRGRSRLSKSSIGAMLNSEELPKYDRFVAYLHACGIRERNLDVWVFTWRRLKALQGPESQWMPGLTSAATEFR
ncbi:helix-turn-helix transcriptional regulator [Streptomyces sp. NBC_01373]|uniref:helix-turn-helix domain-containing protein n=1 Tax=Streptomyces sp. NBC_01373 TaxID=2903843 RepID=UPI0022515361|nr:helix-turn-helix transcriptional regulator [Streptomyces sp. NBC_01373]MCX4707149.1 helix-turn-helix domain-containing protein [Streptomyces sp. NBC_01373]